ncbi:MAG: hypothetical protein QXY47_05275 [Thermoplasmata archaeon]
MTKDQYKILIDLHKETIQTLQRFADGIDRLNDEHKSLTDRLAENTSVLKQEVAKNGQFVKLISLILTALVAAIIILAGAEKALKFL